MGQPSKGKTIPRHELIAAALDLGIKRPESLTESALMAEIRRVSEGTQVRPSELPKSGGWLGVARNLVTSVVEQGLNLPNAARVIRDSVRPRSAPPQRPPMPTVTLAQIYISQGHDARAMTTLREVLRRDPVHPKAQRLLSELLQKEGSAPGAEGASPASEDSSASAHQASPSEDSSASEELPSEDSRASRSASDELPPEDRSARAQSDVAPVVASAAAVGESATGELALLTSDEQEEALVVFRSGDEAVVYWELGRRGRAARRRGARLETRIVAFTPDPRGALAEEQCHAIGEVNGCFRVQCGERAVVRAALGIQEPQRWVVLRVASGVVVQGAAELEPEFRPRKQSLEPALLERARVAALGEEPASASAG